MALLDSTRRRRDFPTDDLRAPRAVAILLSILICGCAYSGGQLRFTHDDGEDAPRKADPSAGLVAPLRGLGSAVSGKVRVIDKGDGITLLVSAINMPIGEFRVAFHRNGNCTSPNGFSAGPAWAPPGLSPATLVPSLSTFGSRDGNAEREIHVAGVHTQGENGLAGRSVVLYQGSSIAEIRPEVPNNAFACGVFEQVRPLF